jgi:hypothetical protein
MMVLAYPGAPAAPVVPRVCGDILKFNNFYLDAKLT